MANVIGFGLDIAVNIAVLAEAFAPRDTGPVAMVGVGSQALGQSVSVPDKETPAGPMPHITLYDSHGRNFAVETAFGEELVDGDNEQVHFQAGLDSDNLHSDPQLFTKPDAERKGNSPEAVRLLAFEKDATCISYVTVTGVDGTHTSWHASYAKQCGAPWYPSPEIFPTTSFVPGCVWLTNNAKFPGLSANGGASRSASSAPAVASSTRAARKRTSSSAALRSGTTAGLSVFFYRDWLRYTLVYVNERELGWLEEFGRPEL